MYSYHPTLHVYIVFRPDDEHSGTTRAGLAQRLYGHLCRDADEPLLRGLGIPVYFRSAPAGDGNPLPLPIELDPEPPGRALRTMVIVLAESGMVPRRFGWQDYLKDIRAGVDHSGGRHLLLPVALDENAHRVAALGSIQGLRYDPSLPAAAAAGDPEAVRAAAAAAVRDAQRKLLTEISQTLCAFLRREPPQEGVEMRPPAPVRLFISHAKRDGRTPAVEFKEAVENLPLDRFFDEVSIAAGYLFEPQIEQAVQESVMLALVTDKYSSRPWCRREAAEAKRHQCPVVVVDMLEELDLRSFPYLGNAPVIRWTGTEHAEAIFLAMTEALRFEYHERRLRSLREQGCLPPGSILLPRAPEATDCAHLPFAADDGEGGPVLIYPEPLLGPEESAFLSALRPGVTFTTPSVPVAGEVRIPKVVALSISGSTDLARFGFGETHLHDLMTEVARHLLARGATLAYGGHHAKKEFTDRLFELVASYRATGAVDVAPVRNYLAWPLHRSLSVTEEAELDGVAEIFRIPLPTDLMNNPEAAPVGTDVAADRASESGRYVWARCLTPMRERMTRDLNVRVVMGGPVAGSVGKYPGLLEEALLALRAGKPTFLLGAFGGCGRAVIDALLGRAPESLTETFQRRDPVYAEMMDRYNRDAVTKPELRLEPIDYAGATGFLQSRGIAGLNNGLSEEENLRLFQSADPDEILYLLLKGLRSLLNP